MTDSPLSVAARRASRSEGDPICAARGDCNAANLGEARGESIGERRAVRSLLGGRGGIGDPAAAPPPSEEGGAPWSPPSHSLETCRWRFFSHSTGPGEAIWPSPAASGTGEAIPLAGERAQPSSAKGLAPRPPMIKGRGSLGEPPAPEIRRGEAEACRAMAWGRPGMSAVWCVPPLAVGPRPRPRGLSRRHAPWSGSFIPNADIRSLSPSRTLPCLENIASCRPATPRIEPPKPSLIAPSASSVRDSTSRCMPQREARETPARPAGGVSMLAPSSFGPSPGAGWALSPATNATVVVASSLGHS